ncbi:hypothetical protein LGN12_30340 [Burkholderia multivorans]|nr:hypothetical protein [Burkholderia multivorans]
MWSSNAGPALKRAFDSAIAAAYGSGRQGELENLADLFSDNALDSYQQALLSGLDPLSDASVDVAWIDKRPIAKIAANNEGAELGDMMLVVNERDTFGAVLKSRACLLEVKQAPQIPIPPVPVFSDASTLNQFAILSSWPVLTTLKMTGRNVVNLLENVDTNPANIVGGTVAQAWYVAVKPKSSGGAPTPDPWVAAPAVAGADFCHSLGDVFGACARGDTLHHPNPSIGAMAVGRGFSRIHPFHGQTSWDALISAIIFVTEHYNLPAFYFPLLRRKRYRRGIFRPPFLFSAVGFVDPSALGWMTVGILIGLIFASIFFYKILYPWRWVLGFLGVPFWRKKYPRWPFQKRFPVIVFNVFHGDPENNRKRERSEG